WTLCAWWQRACASRTSWGGGGRCAGARASSTSIWCSTATSGWTGPTAACLIRKAIGGGLCCSRWWSWRPTCAGGGGPPRNIWLTCPLAKPWSTGGRWRTLRGRRTRQAGTRAGFGCGLDLDFVELVDVQHPNGGAARFDLHGHRHRRGDFRRRLGQELLAPHAHPPDDPEHFVHLLVVDADEQGGVAPQQEAPVLASLVAPKLLSMSASMRTVASSSS